MYFLWQRILQNNNSAFIPRIKSCNICKLIRLNDVFSAYLQVGTEILRESFNVEHASKYTTKQREKFGRPRASFALKYSSSTTDKNSL